MRLRNTLLLLLFFISLGAYIYLFELRDGPQEERDRLIRLKEEEVGALVLMYREREIRLEKGTSGRWRLTHPIETLADESTIRGVLSALKNSKIKRTVEIEPKREDLPSLGLHNRWLMFFIKKKNGSPLPLIFLGAKAPVGNSAYIKRSGETSVLLTDASLRSSLDKRLLDFREKRILQLKDAPVNQLTLHRADGKLILVKKEKDWVIQQPGPYRADQAQVTGLLSTLENMRAREFLEESPAELGAYGLDDPRLQIFLALGREEPLSVLLGNRKEGKDEVYLALKPQGTLFTVHESVFEMLDRDLDALRDKKILRIDRDKVVRLDIEGQEGTLVLLRGGDGAWKTEAAESRKAKTDAVRDYLESLDRLRAMGFADDEPADPEKFGLEDPSLKITLEGEEREAIATLLLGEPGPGEFYARRSGEPTVYTLEESQYRRIKKKPADFFEEEKAEPPPSGPTSP
ncbi:MAG: DUF4340 domain-containing protein [Candidatus Binatia bacterium]|nr:DUF4340 domain-containing protein [Candidatus Binatia bacterium]